MLLKWRWGIVLLSLVLCSPSAVWASGPKVDSITPSCGSLNGGTRITIYGSGFAKNFFNFGAGNEDLGSRVQLANINSYDCEIHPDGSHETQIMCYTVPMASGEYDVKVSVDGVAVATDRYCDDDNDCKFTVSSDCTPTITSISPVSGMPGGMLEINGNIITTKYGSNEPDEFEKILLRVYYGGQKCELRDTVNDTLYGITLEDDVGQMKCLTEGTYIGNSEISFLVSKEFGRSLPDGRTRHVRRTGPGMFQSFTEISHMSQSQGSLVGGTRLTITGQHFDETVSPAQVLVGGRECTVLEPVTDTTIVCSTPVDASVGVTDYTGGRGMYSYSASGTTDPSSVDPNSADVEHVDASGWQGTTSGGEARVVRGFFVPPYSGDYTFSVDTDGTASIFVSPDSNPANKVDLSSSSSSQALVANTTHYVEIQHGSSNNDKHFKLVARLAQTDLTEEDTGMAEHEIQDLEFTSTVTTDIHVIDVVASGSASSDQADVQTVSISGNPSAYFAIGLDGVYTVPLQMSVTSSELTEELKKLPNIDFDVSAEVRVTGSDVDLVITCDSSQGEISDFTGRVVAGQDNELTFSTVRTTPGAAKLDTFTLTMEGKPTPPIPVGASTSEVTTALETLFGVQCHPKLSEGKAFDFEEADDWVTGRVSDEEPFCGRYSVKNPRYIFHKGYGEKDVGVRVSTTSGRFMCFAYKGLGKVNSVKVGFKYTTVDTQEDDGSIRFSVSNDNSTIWSYWCEDIYVLIDAAITGSGIVVEYAQAFRVDSDEDLFIDQVIFNREKPVDDAVMDGVFNMRSPQAKPNGYLIDTVTVTAPSATRYQIELSPHDCGHDFPLFEVAGASKSGSSYSIRNGGSITVTPSRTQTASPPIAGTFTVSFLGDTSPSPIPVTIDIDSDNIVANLGTMNVGFSEVTGSGTCAAFTYRVKMLSTTGDQPLMEIDGSQLTGTNPQATVTTVQDGGLWFDPIMGDLLRTYHATPQVMVFINDIPTRCSSPTACTFEWSNAFTPTVSSISPTSGSNGDGVSITGTGFDGSIPSNNEVVIGTTPCTVTAATSTTITCTINNGPTGEANVNVFVAGKGLADTSVKFTYVTGVSGVSPSSGSVQGGTLLTIDGFGFTSDAVVTLDGSECARSNISESRVTCKTPQAASASASQTVDVVITQSGSSSVAGQFTFDPSLTYTPTIASISQTSSNVWGGDSLLIVGQGFGSVEMPVTLGGVQLNVTSYTDTQIVVVLPALSHGSYKIYVDVENKGYADLRINSVSDISYSFQVQSMTPTFGSLYGGTDILITGVGFGSNKSLIDVTLGSHTCDVQTLTSTQIECRIADTGIRHTISATGTHKSYGVGYAWDKDPHTVNVGDYVTWTWSTPFYVSDIVYGVHQTASASDLESMEGGFSSGTNTRSGSFTHRFTTEGTFFYWTSYMDSNNIIYFRGTITVAPLTSHAGALSVQMQGSEASYDTAASPVTATTTCASSSSQLSGCTDSTSLTLDATKFNFQFLKCYSPYINSMSRTNGTTNDVVTFAGDGFGDTDCQNEVHFDGSTCNTVASSSSSVGFQISAVDSPAIGVLLGFTMRVGNLGYALNTLAERDQQFGLLPRVENLTPFDGSKVGGTKLTITGTGFEGGADNIYVDFNYMSCSVESATYTSIVCETECSSAPSSCYVGRMTASVRVGTIWAECLDPSCNFITDESKTASITDISPNSVSSASTSIAITGAGFGTVANDLSVEIGGEECTISGSVTDTSFTCEVERLPVGDNTVDVYVANNGKAATTLTVRSEKIASIASPSESSTYGGAIMTLSGNGFVYGKTNVTVGGLDCHIDSASFDQVTCTLPAHSDGSQTVIVTSKGVQYDTLSLTYSTAETPDVTDITPSGGRSGDSVTIDGTGFKPSSTNPTVTIGGVECSVASATDTSITCNVGTQQTGSYAVKVFVPERGNSNEDISFIYQLGSFSISPSTGSTNGGQEITLSGSGFLENSTAVTVCGDPCEEVSVSASEYVCVTPTAANPSASVDCDVVVTVDGVTETNTNAYSYDPSLVSTITSVSPTRGGTGGGTLITITGTNFGSNPGDISVTIAGAVCTVQDVTNTEITCRTGAASSADAVVSVQRNGWGEATQTNAAFVYIDVWSSPYTWGGASPPGEGEFVIIPAGQKILLDTSTDVLTMLLIQGGEVIFDENDIELQAENILITDGGLLQAGSADAPFASDKKAIITLHGFLRSKELPIYGTKTLAVREGTLNLYGSPVTYTWTRLSSTAAAGSLTLELEHSVNWKTGDEVVIATTGDRHSQAESEVHVINSVSVDGYTVTLETPLAYEHLGISGTFGSTTVDFRAEVGLLTRNVVVRGNRNIEFDHQIEACPEGFDTGEFATQTCFQGRFGEELGSDQFGAQIMIHQAEKDTQVAQAHLQYVELTHSGQAFRMGRYPIHFHLNGNMDKSFVKGCSIHTSFNRAVNIHGSHNVMVEHNVIYNVMGGSFFLEDGDETGNSFIYNLAVFVRSSTSLRNDDITPAAFWATNPNNTISHNTAAGGTHFGTWYRMHTHPEGPGYDPNICPQAAPLGEYRNNTAHSLGWFGLWIFETYVPRVGASCSSSADHQVAQFYTLTAWNCEKGAEGVNSGALQFREFVLVNNEKAGYEGKLTVDNPPQYDSANGPGVFDSVIVAHYDNNLRGSATAGGIIQPYHPGFLIENIEFYNFDQSRSATLRWAKIDGTCTFFCGGFKTETSNLQFSNSPNKVAFDWQSEGVLYDRDGSLAGSPGYSVAACTDSFDPGQCSQDSQMSTNLPGCICSDQVKLVRFSFNNILPDSLNFKNAMFISEFGTSYSPWAEKRISHKQGWSMVLMANTYYNFTFENAEHVTNISYDSAFYNFDNGDYVVFTQFSDQKTDLFMLDGETNMNMSDTMLSGNSVSYGEWFYNVPDRSITYAITRTSKKKRSVYLSATDFNIKARVIRCFYRGCEPPQPPMEVREEPTHKERWSDLATWVNFTADGLEPSAMDDLYIPKDKWIIVDKPIPPLGNITIEGGLQFETNSSMDIVLEADFIYITGRFIMGWSDAEPYQGKAVIRLRGSHATPAYPVVDGPSLGAKFIAVFGGLQLHGVDRGITKTSLASTVMPGSNSITVTDSVSWSVDDDILITTTDYNAWHTEVFKISAISGSTITLNDTVQYRHIAHSENVNGQAVDLRASVALLTRNIRIEGEAYPEMESESFGARVVVGQTYDAEGQHSGFAQVSNVEFYHSGQEGFHANYDARFSLTYSDVTSSPDQVRYSYARKNTFHSGYNTAIGVFGVDNLEIDGNVIYHTVGPAIQTESTGTNITNNLATLSIWPATYQDRREGLNYDYHCAIEASLSNGLILVNNTVAGSERGGYHLAGQACSSSSGDLWTNNMAHGCLSGVFIYLEDTPADGTCIIYSGFTFWKNLDFGIYYQSSVSGEFKNNIFVENGAGLFIFVVGADIVGHAFDDKTATVDDNLFIGKTSSFSESEDIKDSTDDNIILSGQARSPGASSPCGKIGLMMSTFSAGGNDVPEKTFINIMSYNTIKGLTTAAGNTFANFGACTGGRDHAITTNPKNDDLLHPLQISGTTLVNVDSLAKVKFHTPNVGKINSADCVDMDCDGLKKNMIRDLDGTFLGSVGTVLPNSAYEWDGDRRHGLGDYRIPSAMLATTSGAKLDASTYVPKKGIYKSDNCTFINEWNAFQCGDSYEYRMVVIESMDVDTETRRLSPVAIYNPEGYVDLINGPQDHGWCSGYTCRKRVSTFHALVALDEPFTIYLSSTNPKVMRYMMLNSDPSECVLLGMWYMSTNRLEVDVDGVVSLPKNGYIDGSGGFRLRMESTPGQYMPNINDKVNGEYYISQRDQLIYWTQCGGPSLVTVSQHEVFVVSFTLPAMTDAELFGEKIVENLAAFLSMDPNKVRIVNIVEDTSTSGRRKRQAGTTTFYVEIADNPGQTNTVDYGTVGQQIVNQAQLYTFDTVINATVLYTSVLEPASNGSSTGQMVTLQKTGQLVMNTHPVGDSQEGQVFTVQPKFKVTDSNGDVVTYLGSVTSAWEIEATIKSGGSASANIIGTTRMNFTEGWANFTDLSITNRGSYILEFNIVSPPEAANYSLESLAVTINGRNIGPKADIKTTNRLTGFPLEMEVSLEDKDTSTDISDVAWANHTWTATAAIYDAAIYSGTLGGTTTTSFDTSTGKATFYNLQLSKPGKCPILVTITSSPSDYVVKMVVLMDAMTSTQKNMVVAEQHTLELKFPITYDTVRAPYWTAQIRNYYSEMTGLRLTGDAHRSGSLIVTLNVEGTTTGYNDTLNSICADIQNSTAFTLDNTTVAMSGYLTVDGVSYYGIACGDETASSDEGLETVYISVIVVLSVIILLLVGILLAYKLYFHPKAKTRATENGRYTNNFFRKEFLADPLSREGTFTSLKSRPVSPPMPPVGTNMPTQAFDIRISSPPPSCPTPTLRRVSPEPNFVSNINGSQA